jgi:hypothetical protein
MLLIDRPILESLTKIENGKAADQPACQLLVELKRTSNDRQKQAPHDIRLGDRLELALQMAG